jgi:hypothetical protein
MGSAAIAGMLILAAPAWGQQKTAKQCQDEWTANKASIQASGKKKKDFIAECRGASGTSTAPASPSPSAAKPAPPPSTAGKGSGTSTAPAGAGEFASEAQAKSHCPGDTVVWANLDSKIYHFGGNRSYGNTKKGAYMCERDTAAAGLRAAKNEKHP